MKKQNIFIALIFAAFIFPFFGNVITVDAQNHDPNQPASGTMPGSNEPMYGGPNDHHCPAGTTCGEPNDHHGVDCAALPTPREVAACWDKKNSQHHDPQGGHMGSCPEGPGYDACIAAQSAASATKHHPGDTCMQHPAGPARDNCYQNQQGVHGGQHHDPNMPPPGGANDHHCPPGTTCGGPNDHHGGPNDHHGDPCMNMPPGPAQKECYDRKDSHPNNPHPGGPNDHHCPPGTTCGGPNDHHAGQDAPQCAAMGMADGSPHVDPPQDIIDQVQAEYEANCKSGNCFLGEGNYKLLEDMGHTRAKVDCFLAEGHRKHDEQHGGPGDGNHPPAP